jgi:hypothetical protein
MAIPTISMDSVTAQGGKPKDYFLIEFFRLWELYREDMVKNPTNRDVIDSTTALLLAVCPHKETREKLWNNYIELITRKENKKSPLTASILTAGDLWTYLSDTLEFTEEAYSGA